MHNGNLGVRAMFLLMVTVTLSIRCFIAGILFTAVTEVDTPSLRVFVWILGMLIVFEVLYKIYKLIKFLKVQKIF